jgi:PleD family two-component response regulator
VTGAPHILIVEDQPSTAEMLASYFETQGYKVTSVAWGKDALASAEKNSPDLIVLDIRLPDIDGYEVCRSLRAQRRTANIPIVFLTDKRSQGDKLKGLKLGAVDYITKPFDIQELRLRVRNILRRSSVDRMSHPVTDLPGPAVSDEHLGRLLTGSGWVVLSVGLHGLDEFADVYGFVARDDVMRAVALMLNHVVSESHDPNAFVGHLNDINFFVVIAPDEVKQVHQALSVRLKEAMAFFYPRIDLETGRKDAGTELPHLGITMGVLKSSAGPFSELEELKHALIEAQQTE